MSGIISRLLVRVALVAASLAWGGFVFTHSVGDPGRGERIATAVLDDDDARAEVAAPISSAIMNATGLPPEQRPLVLGRVDEVLRDPVGARAFVEPFAGSWARLLGEDDARPSEVDVAPLLDDLAIPELDPLLDSLRQAESAETGGNAADPLAEAAAQMPATKVPLPRAELGWMAGVRRTISGAVLPLALVACVLLGVAFAIGNRRWVLRRAGLWGVIAGASWVILPWLAVLAARKWATGADSVISVALEAAVSGLRVAAGMLVLGGITAFAVSFAPVPSLVGEPEPATRSARRERRSAPTRATRRHDVAVPVEPESAPPTMPTPRYVPPGRPRRPIAATADPDDRDALWDYYTS